MANDTNNKHRLAVLFEAYGSDTTRWPAHERDAMQSAATDPSWAADRAELLRAEQAFDHVLQSAKQASDAKPAPEALIARILSRLPDAEVARNPSSIGAASVVSMRGPHSQRVSATGIPTALAAARRPTISRSRPNDWKAASALLAASLVLGLFLGSTLQFETAVRGIGEYAGLSTSQPTYTSALDEALSAQDDEEIL